MTEPIVIVLSTSVVAGIALVCALIVTVLAILDYRRRGRLMKRATSELDAERVSRGARPEPNVQVIKNATRDDIRFGDRFSRWLERKEDGTVVENITIRRPITKEN